MNNTAEKWALVDSQDKNYKWPKNKKNSTSLVI